jgi:hypothetical protein
LLLVVLAHLLGPLLIYFVNRLLKLFNFLVPLHSVLVLLSNQSLALLILFFVVGFVIDSFDFTDGLVLGKIILQFLLYFLHLCIDVLFSLL